MTAVAERCSSRASSAGSSSGACCWSARACPASSHPTRHGRMCGGCDGGCRRTGPARCRSGIGWALTVGVRLETLWYAVVTFRSDASAVIASQDAEGATGRIWLLVLVFVGTGMALLLLWFLVRVRDLLRHDLVATVAVIARAAMVAVDLAGGRGQRQLLAPRPLRAHPRRGAGPGTPADRRRAPLAGPPGAADPGRCRRDGRREPGITAWVDAALGPGCGAGRGTHGASHRRCGPSRGPGPGLRRASGHQWPVGRRRPATRGATQWASRATPPTPTSGRCRCARSGPGPGRRRARAQRGRRPGPRRPPTSTPGSGSAPVRSSAVISSTSSPPACDRYRVYRLGTVRSRRRPAQGRARSTRPPVSTQASWRAARRARSRNPRASCVDSSDASRTSLVRRTTAMARRTTSPRDVGQERPLRRRPRLRPAARRSARRDGARLTVVQDRQHRTLLVTGTVPPTSSPSTWTCSSRSTRTRSG